MGGAEYLCVFRCVLVIHVLVLVCVCIHAHVEIGGQPWIFLWEPSPLYFETQFLIRT